MLCNIIHIKILRRYHVREFLYNKIWRPVWSKWLHVSPFKHLISCKIILVGVTGFTILTGVGIGTCLVITLVMTKDKVGKSKNQKERIKPDGSWEIHIFQQERRKFSPSFSSLYPEDNDDHQQLKHTYEAHVRMNFYETRKMTTKVNNT